MRKRWTDRDVNLNSLGERIERFLRDEGFKTEKQEIGDEYLIHGLGGGESTPPLKVTVRISGSSEDFLVELKTAESQTRFTRMFSSLLSLFGGGFLVSRSWKKEEVLRGVERRFRIFLEEAVDLSAQRSLNVKNH